MKKFIDYYKECEDEDLRSDKPCLDLSRVIATGRMLNDMAEEIDKLKNEKEIKT